MENIKVALKRFLKNKNTVTIIALLTSLAILYYAYNLRIKKATEPISVPYAVRRLEPRTLIENKDVGIKQVPGGMVNGRDVIASSSLIVGKYVSEKVVAIYDKRSPAYGYRYILYSPIGKYVGHHKIMQRSPNGYGFDGIPEGAEGCNENSPVPCFRSLHEAKHFYYPDLY